MEGTIIGVFGTDKEVKNRFEGSVAKKSEVEGMIVYHRNEAGRRLSFLDDPQYPERVQGYARIASISDYAFYLFPPNGRVSAPDGELAVLLDSFQLPGRVEVIGGGAGPEEVKRVFKGLSLAAYPVESRAPESSMLDLSGLPGSGAGGSAASSSRPRPSGTLVYVDRAFSVRGVGTVALGFILTGKVSLHDRLRAIPSSPEKTVEVKGIQVNDEDQEVAGPGIRVGLSLKGVDAKELDKTAWLDDGSFSLSQSISFTFDQSAYYKQGIDGRELHVQLPGETALAGIKKKDGNVYSAALPTPVPLWEGLRLAVIDLNGKSLRVAGGGSVRGP